VVAVAVLVALRLVEKEAIIALTLLGVTLH
jgi:hypothetical protein